MAQRQCEKCTEMVDEAKAFCPACGHAFVEEQRRTGKSDFEAMDSTVQLGQTMYNQMLSDLGLNISKSPEKVEKRVEVLIPEAAPAQPRHPSPQTLSPAAPAPKPAAPAPANETVKWLFIAGAFLVLIFFGLIVVAGLLYWFWPRIVN